MTVSSIPVLTLLSTFNQIRRPGAGLPSNSETGISAGCNLEGGLTSLVEGLASFRIPCAEVLSVAGFFASSGPFPGSGRVYSEGKKEGFPPRRAFSLQQPGNNRHPTDEHDGAYHTHRVYREACTQRRLPTRVYREAYTPGGVPSRVYQEVYTRRVPSRVYQGEREKPLRREPSRLPGEGERVLKTGSDLQGEGTPLGH